MEDDRLIRLTVREILNETSPLLAAMVTKDTLKALMPQAHAPSSEENVKWAEQDRIDAAKNVIEVFGYLPGPHDQAINATAAIIAFSEQKYFEAALFLIFCIPVIGKILSYLRIKPSGIIKTGKISANAAIEIANHADEITREIAKLDNVLPNNALIKEAVDKIISACKVGGEVDIRSLATSQSLRSVSTEKSAVEMIASNDQWKTWVKDITKPVLTTILNSLDEKVFKTRLMNALTIANREYHRRSKLIPAPAGATPGSFWHGPNVEELIADNNKIVELAKERLPKIGLEIASNLKINFVTSASQADELGSLGHMIDYGDFVELNVVIPKHLSMTSIPAYLVTQIKKTIRHEIWHIVDNRLAKIFIGDSVELSNKFSSDLVSSGIAYPLDILNKVLRNPAISPKQSHFYRELYAGVHGLRDDVGKSIFTKDDILNLVNGKIPLEDEEKVIVDSLIKAYSEMPKDSSAIEYFLSSVAKAFNDIPE
jgi:hypothetical protein